MAAKGSNTPAPPKKKPLLDQMDEWVKDIDEVLDDNAPADDNRRQARKQ